MNASNSRQVFSSGGGYNHGSRSAVRHAASVFALRTAPTRVIPASECRRSSIAISLGAGHASRPTFRSPFQPLNSHSGNSSRWCSLSSQGSVPGSTKVPRSRIRSGKVSASKFFSGAARAPPRGLHLVSSPATLTRPRWCAGFWGVSLSPGPLRRWCQVSENKHSRKGSSELPFRAFPRAPRPGAAGGRGQRPSRSPQAMTT